MFSFIKRYIFLSVILILSLTACGLPSKATPTSVNYIQTAAAGTVIAQLTQAVTTGMVEPISTVTPQLSTSIPANTAVFFPTATLTPIPTNASIVSSPAATQTVTPCDRVKFLKDITYPDDTEISLGDTFVKTWRLKNTGSCTWNSSYSIVFDKGDAMLPSGSQSSFQLTTGTVAPGQEIDISITLQAPDKTGTYEGFWKLRNGNGVLFGIGEQAEKAFWVKVKAIDKATPTVSAKVQFDFISKGPSAEWHNATVILPWGDPGDDTPGVVDTLDNVKLNDDKSYARILATYPQKITDGVIFGIYPSYTVQDKDHFKTSLGFRAPCGEGNVKFQLKYREGGSEVSLGEWVKSCNDELREIDIDLTSLKGKNIQFILLASANGIFDEDKAVWLAPRIEH